MGSRSYDEAYGMFLNDVRARWAGVFWSSWAALMVGRAACVGRTDADVLRLGDPEGVGRLGRRGGRWPGVRPRTVRFGGGRGTDGWVSGMGGGGGDRVERRRRLLRDGLVGWFSLVGRE